MNLTCESFLSFALLSVQRLMELTSCSKACEDGMLSVTLVYCADFFRRLPVTARTVSILDLEYSGGRTMLSTTCENAR